MHVVHHPDAPTYRARTHAFLHAREAERSMLLGNILSPRIEQPGTQRVTVEGAGEIVALALLVPGRRLLGDVVDAIEHGDLGARGVGQGFTGPAAKPRDRGRARSRRRT